MNKYIVIGIALLVVSACALFSFFRATAIPVISSDYKLSIIKAKSTAINIYVVREGDTLPNIAALFGVPKSTILWANHLSTNSTLQVGQVLYIPPMIGVKYTVKSGDTLESIAQDFNSSAADIETFNSIGSTSLTAGFEIIIPDPLPSSHR